MELEGISAKNVGILLLGKDRGGIMNFNNPQVRARVISHINFAVGAVHAAFTDIPEIKDPDLRAVVQQSLGNPIIMQLLSFTLNLDYELKNTLIGTDKGL